MLKPQPSPYAVDDTVQRRSVGRTIGITLFSIIAVIVVIALIGVGFVTYTAQRSFPQLSGEVAVPGLDAQVTVQRDELGIPTITADSSHDLFFAQGYVHAQDRFWEMDFRRHVTSGRLSELFGESQLGTDKFLRTLGWHDVAQQEVDALSETERAYYDAYADGVNAYLADHQGADASFEYAVLGLQNAGYEIEPWTPADSVAWLKAMAWDLRSNIEPETERAVIAPDFTEAQIDELYPGYPFDRNPVIVPEISTVPAVGTVPDAGEAAAEETDSETDADTSAIRWTEVDSVIEAVGELVGGAGEGIGSNSWVVSGNLTESGMPLLANDPHLGASLPSVWHQIQLKCATVTDECPFDVAGFSFSGLPGVIIGHNERVAWGFTNLTTDVTDLYLEKIDGDSAWYDGALVPLETRTETFKVAGGDDVELEVRSTVNGPIVSGLTDDFTAIADDPFTGTAGTVAAPATPPTGEYAVSLRWTALQPGTTASALFALNTAKDFDDFRGAAALFDVPAQNLVYADVDGNIGYQTPGKLPIRGAGDGSMPQPGWDSAYAWQGFIPFEELPVSYNPTEGYIVTANNAIVGADYTYGLTRDWDYGWRAARIDELIQRAIAKGPVTADDLVAIQADNYSFIGMRLTAAYADVTTGDDETDDALALLQEWDAQNGADSAAAAYANVLWDTLAQNVFVDGRETPAPLSGQGRLFLVMDALLDDETSPWWTNDELGVDGMADMLKRSAIDAYERLVDEQGDNPSRWNWGSLHALPLRNGTFGESGIAPIEWLFNRGPFPAGGGSSVVNATGWDLGSSFETVTVPSMRMVIDLEDFDQSRWNQLTGQSGHAFHTNYIDQVESWQKVELTPWAYTADAVDTSTTDTLVLTP
ncbi:penicillin acylase family protein [Microbacterium sp. M3]|uniref:Penicillin acylase family protein n=1 Tax=Microbacterium arthrosphaerae TaxID=792652 RepID=A0ABU4H5D9_9MICO|nr:MULTISPECIES: penicillin acylase family protein [Microbacterium]MDW4574548.1 penicillin acylase family protein [Microbacterium arthrosphaerae]MDW7608403.1 penicillin acylase family protein [Microbacterium sp. M3]